MNETMKRGRSQVIWRYTPGATFRYNESGGWCRVSEVTLRDAHKLQGALKTAVTTMLRQWDAIGPQGYPDPDIQTQKYEVGEPGQVFYSVWPTVFVCRMCGRVHWFKDIEKLRQADDRLRCFSCNGRDQLRQVPYAYVHECGRIDSIYIPKHDHPIELVDKGSFQESYWYCRVCHKPLGRRAKDGLGFRSCGCGKAMRGILLEDSRVYFAQNLALVDIEPKALDPWNNNPRFSDILLGGALGISAYKASDLLDLAKYKANSDSLSPELKAMRTVLLASGMTEAQADAMIAQTAQIANADPWTGYDAELSALRGMAGSSNWAESRRTIEYVFVRDELSAGAIALDALIEEARQNGDQGAAERLLTDRELAADLGLVDLRIVESLPIMLAGVGYTRYFASMRDVSDASGTGDGAQNEQQVALRPYESRNGKIPIFQARNTTEAMLYNLDPWRLAAFLQVNLDLEIPSEALQSMPTIRTWLLKQGQRLVTDGESHFVLLSREIDNQMTVDEPSALLFGVLHSLSHVLKATAHRYVGISDDSLAEYLFPAHAAGLLYASSNVSFTLGGIDAVFRSNLRQWLGSARDFASRCSFDPVCEHSGGACLACLYPKFGCTYFNRTVSRAFLFGGTITGRQKPIMGFWTSTVADAAKQLQLAYSVHA